ncbi:hypothetical protein TNIN_271251 [Trichonephila inaurata madagascariensis]|uniref:Uncharacterized protein n=1 Tax=Trichonephila inaurata madagascariensis TaxID=2747483 RepID=A0A8X7C6R1_9ARAC|nr:hypothetical protein TNIN_271251 [Trichonephila inaurata madagascariensis]
MKPRLHLSATARSGDRKMLLIFACVFCFGTVVVSSFSVESNIPHLQKKEMVTEFWESINSHNTKVKDSSINKKSNDVSKRSSSALEWFDDSTDEEISGASVSARRFPKPFESSESILGISSDQVLKSSNYDKKVDGDNKRKKISKKDDNVMIPKIRYGRSDYLIPAPQPRFGRSNYLTSIPRFERSDTLIPVPRTGRSVYVIPTPRSGKSDHLIPAPRLGRSNYLMPIPRYGRSSYLIPAPLFGRSENFISEPRLERSNFLITAPRVERFDYLIPVPRVERSDYLIPVPLPRVGRSNYLIPAPRVGRSNYLIPVPRVGRSNYLIPVPRVGRSNYLIPAPRVGRSNYLIPVPRVGRSNYLIPVPRVGRSKDLIPVQDRNMTEKILYVFTEIDNIKSEDPEVYNANNFGTKRNSDGNETIIPYPRPGRVAETKSEEVKNELESMDMAVKRQTNDTLIPQIRYG